MKYEKPECECGEELNIHEHTMHITNRKINKDGRLTKNFDVVVRELRAAELYCTSCRNSYPVDFDEGGRVVKGCY